MPFDGASKTLPNIKLSDRNFTPAGQSDTPAYHLAYHSSKLLSRQSHLLLHIPFQMPGNPPGSSPLPAPTQFVDLATPNLHTPRSVPKRFLHQPLNELASRSHEDMTTNSLLERSTKTLFIAVFLPSPGFGRNSFMKGGYLKFVRA